MTGPAKEWHYTCPADDCSNRVEAEPVPNTVVCGICGAEMVVYTIEEGK